MFEVYYINNNKTFETYQELLEDKNFNDIIKIYCYDNQITSLDNLPVNLEVLNCSSNQLTSLDNLPAKLKTLFCYDNQIANLDNLPNSLETLNCSNNQINNLDNLPDSLETLYCHNNQITSLNNLTAFDEGVRNPTELDFLPNLKNLRCNNNQLTSLDKLPNSLETLNCNNNQLTSLDFLPNSLEILSCNYNQITSLDNLPAKLKYLYCYDNNKLTSLNNLLLINLKELYYNNTPIYEIVNKYFDEDLKKYNLWKQNYLKKFVLKIENWFLECKYNPEYKYCQKFVMEGYNFYETSVSSERSFNNK